MIVWIDVFSGDEMISDSYKHKLIFNDAALEVKAKFVTKGSDFVAIAGKLQAINKAHHIVLLSLQLDCAIFTLSLTNSNFLKNS